MTGECPGTGHKVRAAGQTPGATEAVCVLTTGGELGFSTTQQAARRPARSARLNQRSPWRRSRA
jgi:hypothetical protein